MSKSKNTQAPTKSEGRVEPKEPYAEIPDLEEDEVGEVLPLRYSITSYGADYTVDVLVKRLEEGSIIVPSFQRGYVWNAMEASRFIESLLLGLPVPGIFMSKEQESQRLLVIDGQQRLLTLLSFYTGTFPNGKPFRLQNVQGRLVGRAYDTLDLSDRRALNDSVIHATIVKQDNPKEDNSSIYYIFERLNTGGVRLEPQEIRASLYHGQFNALLRTLNSDTQWRELYGPTSKKMRDQEMILRFFALYFHGGRYKAPMKGFLNDFMRSNHDLAQHSEGQLTILFKSSIALIRGAIGAKAFKPSRTFNAAVYDAVMVGIAKRLQDKPLVEDLASVAETYENLFRNFTFIQCVTTGTGQDEKVATRLKICIDAFARVK